MKYFYLIIIMVFLTNLSAQDYSVDELESKTYFSEQIYRYYSEFQEKSSRAFNLGNRDDAEFYYNQLVEEHLVGSYMDNFNIYCLSDGFCKMEDFEKPLILLTYASWNVPTKGEIPAFNSIAKKYSDQVDFAVIFWDKKKDARKAAKAYNKDIEILYVDELQNRYAHTVKMLKHSLGFPTIFVVGSNKRIIEIKRNLQNNWDLELEMAIENSLNEFTNLVKTLQNFESQLITDSLE